MVSVADLAAAVSALSPASPLVVIRVIASKAGVRTAPLAHAAHHDRVAAWSSTVVAELHETVLLSLCYHEKKTPRSEWNTYGAD